MQGYIDYRITFSDGERSESFEITENFYSYAELEEKTSNDYCVRRKREFDAEEVSVIGVNTTVVKPVEIDKVEIMIELKGADKE